jgi:hypothetical protein
LTMGTAKNVKCTANNAKTVHSAIAAILATITKMENVYLVIIAINRKFALRRKFAHHFPLILLLLIHQHNRYLHLQQEIPSLLLRIFLFLW